MTGQVGEDQQVATETTTLIKMRAVEKHYGAFHALKNINLEIMKGEKVVLFLAQERSLRRRLVDAFRTAGKDRRRGPQIPGRRQGVSE